MDDKNESNELRFVRRLVKHTVSTEFNEEEAFNEALYLFDEQSKGKHDRLLEHINFLIKTLKKAKKELEHETNI